MKTNYDELNKQTAALFEGVPYLVTNLANAAALLYDALDDINWAGFYLFKDGALWLGPFCGKPACVKIAVGRGVCGTAFAGKRTLVVPDVHAFPGHIACDAASRSEIVVPIMIGGEPIGVLDIDSPIINRFSSEDRTGLEAIVRTIEKKICGQFNQI